MKNKQTHEWLALTAIGLFTVMANLDSSIVNIALPTLSRDFKIPTSMAAYTVIIYMVVMSGLLVLGGRLGDIISKSRIFKYGMYVFTFGSLLASISPNFDFLQIARIVQAIGASATLANSYGLISQIFPPATRGKAMGFNTLFISGGFIIGPALGGLLLQHFIWQSIFMINLPIGVIAIIMGTLFLPRKQSGKMPKQFDWLGAVLLFFNISAFILFLEMGQTIGFSSLIVIEMVVGFVVVGIWFVIHEQRHPFPLLDMSIFKIREFTLTLFALVFVMMTNSFFDIVFPFYLQSILKWSVGTAGLMMIVFPAVMAIVAPLGGGLGDHFDRVKIAVIGACLLVIAQLIYMTFGLTTTVAWMIGVSAVNGIGTGFFVANNTTLIMAQIPRPQLGVAGAVQSLLTNIGQVLGVVFANLSLYMTTSVKAGRRITTIPNNHPEWFISGMHIAFGLTALFSVLALILVLRSRQRN